MKTIRLFAQCFLLAAIGFSAAIAVANESISDRPSLGSVPESTAEIDTLQSEEAMLGLPSWFFTGTRFDSDVVGFRLQRDEILSTALGLADMDAAIAPNGERYIPVARLFALFQARVFDPTFFDRRDVFVFQVEYGPFTIIDLKNAHAYIDGQRQPINYIAGLSDISGARDIYLSPQLIEQIFKVKINWDDQLYEFIADTKNVLNIWRAKRTRWSGADAELIVDDLPSKFDVAGYKTNTLDFIETRTSVSVDAQEDNDTMVSFNTSQNFWGGLWGGRYRARFSQPNLSWRDGEGFDSGDQNISVPRRFTWEKQHKSRELVVGDSSFALNELAYPFIDFAGVRFNGIAGEGSEDVSELSGYGLTDGFLGTRRFEGNAELGSEVTLFVNDNPIATVDVDEEPDSPEGFGRYIFDEVSIPAGNNVSIRIEIQEPGGRLIIKDESITTSAKLRPAGQFTYVAGVGTNRSKTKWDSDGVLGGARMQYGLTSWATVGATIGYSKDVIDTDFTVNFQSDRPNPTESEHFGLELTASPFAGVVISIDAASSLGVDDANGFIDDRYEGSAYKVETRLYPSDRLTFDVRGYRYEPGFYNGSNLDLEDRQGGDVSFSWTPQFATVKAAYGTIENNIDDVVFRINSASETIAVETREATFFSAEFGSRLGLPNTFFRVEYDQITPEFFEEKTAIEYELSTEILKFGINASFVDGDLFELNSGVRDIFQSLNLPLISVNRTPDSALAISRAFGAHRFVLDFDGVETDIDQQVQLTHYWDSPIIGDANRGFGFHSFRIVTELGENRLRDSQFASSRVNFYLDSRRRNRVGMQALWEEASGWVWTLDINLNSVFSFVGDRARNVSHRSSNLNAGGVEGIVFFDKNANGKRDIGEWGIPNISIKSTEAPFGLLTDSQGGFLIQRRPNEHETDVFIDINTVPATLLPVHARQKAKLGKGRYTRIEFALAPGVALSGSILANPPEAEKPLPIKGAVVSLKNREGKLIAESVTASDGTYYFSVAPGEYDLWVDPSTVDVRYVFNEPAFQLTAVGSDDYQEIEFEPIYAGYLNEDNTITKFVPAGSTLITDDEFRALPAATATEKAVDTVAEQPGASVEQGDLPLDLTRPKTLDNDTDKSADTIIEALDAIDALPAISKDFVYASGLVFGEDASGVYVPLADIDILLLDLGGNEIAATKTREDGSYEFRLKEGLYFISFNAKTMDVKYIYDEPALNIEVLEEENSKELSLETIYVKLINN